jgi:spore germination protein GerM
MSITLRQTIRGLAVPAALMLFAGCSISPDSAPRDIPVLQQDELLASSDRAAGAATGTSRIFLLSPEAGGQATTIVEVPRDVDETPVALLVALLAGPNDDELDAQYRTAIPTDVEVRSAQVRGGTLIVDMSAGLLQLAGDGLIDAIAQIVFTSSELPGVRSVKILIDGADQQWPTGTGVFQSTPLSVYDYPGLLASAQPDHPAVPSPSMP